MMHRSQHNPLVDDLIQHVASKVAGAMHSGMQLLDDDDDRYALMMGVTASLVASFIQSISNGSEAFDVLDEQQKKLVGIGMILSTLGGVPGVEFSRETRIKMIRAEQSYPLVRIG